MSVKILYTFDRLHSETCLTRLTGIPIRATEALGVVDLNRCIKAAYRASPELAASDHDYAIYSTDYSEPDEPLVGHGMCSSISTSPQNHIIGKVCKNALPLFASSESLQVKLRFSPMTKLQTSSIATDVDTAAGPNVAATSPAASDTTPHHMGLNDIFDSDQLNRYLSNSPPPPQDHRSPGSPKQHSDMLKSIGATHSLSHPHHLHHVSSPKGGPNKMIDLTTHDTKSQARSRRIERELIYSLKNGIKPTFCDNCGTIRTSTWRKCDSYNLCNPCGLWYKSKNAMRPKSLWQSEVLPRRPKRRIVPQTQPLSSASLLQARAATGSVAAHAAASTATNSTGGITPNPTTTAAVVRTPRTPLRDHSPTPSPKRRRTSINVVPSTPPPKSRSPNGGKENICPDSVSAVTAAIMPSQTFKELESNIVPQPSTTLGTTTSTQAAHLQPAMPSPLTPRKTSRFDEMFHDFFESSPSRRLACLPDLTFSMDSANMSSEITAPSSPPFFYIHDHNDQNSEFKRWKSPVTKKQPAQKQHQ